MKRNPIVYLTIPLLCFLVGGCGFISGNKNSDVQKAIKIAEDQYGVKFELKKKAFFSGGANCNVIVRCDQLPGQDIRIFRFDNRTAVQCDYIYLKYGDKACEKISEVIHTVLPDAKVVISEFGYNHFSGTRYDKNTTLSDYLWDNTFVIEVATYGEYDESEIRQLFNNLAKTLTDKGINAYGFKVYVMNSREAVDAIKTYEHMPDTQSYEGIRSDDIRLYAALNYGRLAEYEEDSEDPNLLSIHVED